MEKKILDILTSRIADLLNECEVLHDEKSGEAVGKFLVRTEEDLGKLFYELAN